MSNKGNWKLDEQLKLINGLLEYGCHSWDKVADHLGSKSPEEIQKYYLNFTTKKEFADFIDVEAIDILDHTKDYTEIDEKEFVSNISSDEVNQKLCEEITYHPRRDEFDLINDSDFEHAISDLSGDEDDDSDDIDSDENDKEENLEDNNEKENNEQNDSDEDEGENLNENDKEESVDENNKEEQNNEENNEIASKRMKKTSEKDDESSVEDEIRKENSEKYKIRKILKLSWLRWYRYQFKRRHKIKKVIKEYNLINEFEKFRNSFTEEQLMSEENMLKEYLKPFAQLIQVDEHKKITENLIKEIQCKSRIEMLMNQISELEKNSYNFSSSPMDECNEQIYR